jgi:hypothetical protein
MVIGYRYGFGLSASVLHGKSEARNDRGPAPEYQAFPHAGCQSPLRVPVGSDIAGMVSGLNRDSAKYQREFLTAFGFDQYAPLAD